MRKSRRMRGGNGTGKSVVQDISVYDDGTTSMAPSATQTGGRRRRRVKSLKKKRSSRKGGSLLGNALLPFGLLWAQKSYQGNRRKSRKHRRTRRRRNRRRR